MAASTPRRFAAIVSADVVGYSRLMGVDEMATLDALRAHRAELIDGKISQNGGRIVKTMGDGLLLEFANAMDAVRCALDIQEGMTARNREIDEGKKIIFRIGVNFSEIIPEGDDIFGDGVNVAARLEGLAEPGGVLISQSAYDGVAEEISALFADNGNKAFKNIARPVHVWSWPRRLPDDRQDRKPFVMVSEFEGRSAEENQLALDLHEELSAALSRLTGLEVTLDRRKADYLFKGGVRLTGGRCRISAQLITVEDDKQLWAERYQMEGGDSFDILDQCIPGMVMNIRRRVAADDSDRLPGKNLDNMTLEQLLSAAGVSFFTPTMQGWSGAGKIAERALQIAPKNFMALAMAAAGHGMAELLYGFKPTDDAVINLALQRIEEARRQTSKSDMVLIVYSGLLLHGRKRYAEAAAAAEASLQLNPDYNMAL
jgi:adenylate cyclase